MMTEAEEKLRQALGMNGPEPPGKIYHTKDPRLPQFEFEWHPGAQKVYRIDLPGQWVDCTWVSAPAGSHANGRCIAEHCMTHAQFLGLVQTFCRGYLLAVVHRDAGALETYCPERITRTDSCPQR